MKNTKDTRNTSLSCIYRIRCSLDSCIPCISGFSDDFLPRLRAWLNGAYIIFRSRNLGDSQSRRMRRRDGRVRRIFLGRLDIRVGMG